MSKRANPEINAGSMADIAFLLLIFFLVTTTMNVDSGIMRSLPDPDAEEVEREVKRRNVLLVFINARDEIMVKTDKIALTELTAKAKEFILNPKDDPDLSEQEPKEVELIGKIRTSKGVISLQSASGTSYDIYVRVQNELTRAYNEIRNEVSLRYFQKPYDKLEIEEQKAIRAAVPLSISEAEPKQ